MSNFNISFSDEALSFGARLFEEGNYLCDLVANIDGTDYKIVDTDRVEHTTYLIVRPFEESTGDYTGKEERLVLYTCQPGLQEIRNIVFY